MAKKQISLWVDSEILRGFDEWVWSRRQASRSAAIEGLMASAAASTVAAVGDELPVRSTIADRVRADLLAGLERERAACSHPRDKRKTFSWGAKCEECGAVVR